MTDIVRVANTENDGLTADIVFLHGIDGDARLTWGAARQGDHYNLEHFWPLWLGADFPDVAVWSVQYDAAGSKWRGSGMPLADRATNLLELLAASRLGRRPLVFITHSMGGLLVKQMLRDLRTNTNVRREWSCIYDHTCGIAFFSTPHNGSLPASLFQQLWALRPGPNVGELAANNPELRKLNQWFRNNIDVSRIELLVYCEAHSTRGFRVVDESSADPGMPGVTVVPLDYDHIEICKLTRDFRYQGVVEFLRRAFSARGSFPRAQNDRTLLEAAESVLARFQELHGKIATTVSSALLFRESWTPQERKELVAKLQALAHSEIALSKARTALFHLEQELRSRRSGTPRDSARAGEEILSACRKYLYALCPNDGVTPFPSMERLLQFLNQILEVRDPAGAEAVLSTAKTYLGVPEKRDLEKAEEALAQLRSLARV